MKKMIFYKEWIKTRWYILAASAVTAIGTGYVLLGLSKSAQFKGNSFLWSFVIAKDSVLIDQLKYLPFILGGLLAAAQMLPDLDLEPLTGTVFELEDAVAAFNAQVSGKYPKILIRCNKDLE